MDTSFCLLDTYLLIPRYCSNVMNIEFKMAEQSYNNFAVQCRYERNVTLPVDNTLQLRFPTFSQIICMMLSVIFYYALIFAMLMLTTLVFETKVCNICLCVRC